jgi:protoporphyrin/coproporphyrin ferrochelatase
MSKTGVLLTAFGGPDCVDAVEPFMTRLMRRQPPAEVVERAKARYEAIGGCSPLPAITARIAAALEDALTSEDLAIPVRVGMRYWTPWIADSLAELVGLGCDRVVTVSLSPFESRVSSGAYREAVEEALADHPDVVVLEAPSFHLAEGFVAAIADASLDAMRGAEDASGDMPVLTAFSAHSLPVADVEGADASYVAQLRETVTAVVARMGLPEGRAGGAGAALPSIDALGGGTRAGGAWLLAFQSKGASPGAWLGPDLADVLCSAAEAGFGAVAVCPAGFLADHMETLYDLDVVAAREAEQAGIAMTRAAVPNDSQGALDALIQAVRPLLVG